MTTDRETIPLPGAKPIIDKLMRALQTMSNDDGSMPGSDGRRRHAERLAAILEAVEFLNAAALAPVSPPRAADVDGLAELSRKAIARIIVGAMQFKEFGHRATQEEIDEHPEGFAQVGDFVSTTGAIDLLQRSAEEAADGILALTRQDGAAGQGVSGPGAVPEGFWLAPDEATFDMCDAAVGSRTDINYGDIDKLWDILKAAAPTPATTSSGPAAVAVEEVEELIGVACGNYYQLGLDGNTSGLASRSFDKAMDAVRRLASPQDHGAVRDDALEEAAEEADRYGDCSGSEVGDAIRNLKTNTDKPGREGARIVPLPWPGREGEGSDVCDGDVEARLQGMSDLYWRMRALHEARMHLIGMVVQQERARSGKGKAWNGTFYAKQLALLSRPDLEPCMVCGGKGYETDPETGPGACNHCGGDGVFPPAPSDAPRQHEKTEAER